MNATYQRPRSSQALRSEPDWGRLVRLSMVLRECIFDIACLSITRAEFGHLRHGNKLFQESRRDRYAFQIFFSFIIYKQLHLRLHDAPQTLSEHVPTFGKIRKHSRLLAKVLKTMTPRHRFRVFLLGPRLPQIPRHHRQSGHNRPESLPMRALAACTRRNSFPCSLS